MKITKLDITKIIKEELEEIRVSRLGDIYSHGGMEGGNQMTMVDDEEEGSPCAMAAAEESPDLETRVASIEDKLDMILSQLQLSEEKDDNWIQDAEKDIERRGTEGVCSGKNFGSEKCPPGSKRYNLAKTFRKMAKDRKKKYALSPIWKVCL